MRTIFFDNIEERLTTLITKIHLRNSLNLMDINIQSEQVFKNVLNFIYKKSYINSNYIEFNSEAFDLCDESIKEIIQVTSTNSKKKIDNTLKKEILKKYSGYHLKIFIIDVKTHLNKYEYKELCPAGILFDSKRDILSCRDLLNEVLNMNINEQNKLSELLNNEIGTEPSIIKTNSILTMIVNILAQKDLKSITMPNLNEFEINRKIEFNNLMDIKSLILNYKNFFEIINEIYSTMDKEGFNKSLMTLQHISDIYNQICTNRKSDIDIYFSIVDLICNEIKQSANFNEDTTVEELLYCVQILVVDAFIKCKIFKNPEGYTYVIA